MRPRNLDLNQLRTLVAVADLGTVTRAAERLSYTQSAVSMQLQRLETSVGMALHQKAGRQVRLTADGERLLGYARRMLAMNDEALADLKRPVVQGTLKLGIPEDYATLLSSALVHFTQLYPSLNLEVHCGNSESLVNQVRQGDLDLALVTRQRHSPGGEVIRREPLVWAVGLHHQPPLNDPLPMAFYSPGADVFREEAEQALESAGRRWRVAYGSQSMVGLRPIVDAGLAVAVVTRHMVTAGLRVLDESSGLPPLPVVEIALHRPPGRPTEAVQQLAELLRQQLAGEGV
ncbi:transcriptional regulator [Tamilnaduibacter salinus]|uniref:Transcriptional regulator n=1 Tax=Tamilnaduibacter salinus TaxID=1484056 RepID=A0A2A2I523_9GAMM|nr:LysR substrate-binding domain-containing protein [Tamilnaduibacter salinus]PAV26682.1 transcriptional regulator [Tamilnaduibacter salinus]